VATSFQKFQGEGLKALIHCYQIQGKYMSKLLIHLMLTHPVVTCTGKCPLWL